VDANVLIYFGEGRDVGEEGYRREYPSWKLYVFPIAEVDK